MNIQLIDGVFEPNDAFGLIEQMLHIKIKFHENKVDKSETEEDIKARETKIIRLQKDLFELKKTIGSTSNGIKLNAVVNIDLK